MLFVDKFCPKQLKDLTYHVDIAERLQALAASDDMPHMLFYGPSGAGKKTRIMAYLRQVFGNGVDKMTLQHRTFKTASNKEFEISFIGSNFHLEINPSDAGFHDRLVVKEMIKEIAQLRGVDSATAAKRFKVIVLMEVDRLSREAQASLRRTMEKYSRSCRLILCCESLSRVIEPVRSRCMAFRIAAPTHTEVAQVLMQIGKRAKTGITLDVANRFAKFARRNLRRAIMAFEATSIAERSITMDTTIQLMDWEAFIATVANDILSEQSTRRLLAVRGKLYELLVNCIPADVIIKTLARELTLKVDSDLKPGIIQIAADYEHRLQLGSKDIFHLEAFAAKIMCVQKSFAEKAASMFG